MANRSKSAVANGNCETFKSRRGGMPKRVVIGFHFVCPGEKGVTPNGDGTVWTGTWVVDREAALITIAGPLPAELHAHHRPMLHDRQRHSLPNRPFSLKSTASAR